jgi:hypothetical protein
MNEQRKFKQSDFIPAHETKAMKESISHLIARHNLLCLIESELNRYPEIMEYHDMAVREVESEGESGTIEIAKKLIAIMGERLHEYERGVDPDFDNMRNRIRQLEAENKGLIKRLDMIANFAKEHKEECADKK